MSRKRICRNLLVGLLSAALAGAGTGAQGEMLRADTSSAIERERVAAALRRPEIRSQFAAYGVDIAEAEARVAALTDEEVTALGAEFDQLPAGGSDPRGIFALIVVAVAVYIVIKLWPFFLIGGGAYAAAKAKEKNDRGAPQPQEQEQPSTEAQQ